MAVNASDVSFRAEESAPPDIPHQLSEPARTLLDLVTSELQRRYQVWLPPRHAHPGMPIPAVRG
jgi:hypothetical protein